MTRGHGLGVMLCTCRTLIPERISEQEEFHWLVADPFGIW